MNTFRLGAAGFLLALGLVSCGGGNATEGGSGFPNGSLQTNPGTGKQFIVEANEGGQASSMQVVSAVWGRLVDVFHIDPLTGDRSAEPLFVEFLIGNNIQSDGTEFELSRSVLTGKDELTILFSSGTPAFKAAFDQLEQGLQPFLIKGLVNSLPPYTQVPRNAAIAVIFDDLLKDGGDPTDPGYPGTVKRSNIGIEVGYPPSATFEFRAIPDPNHGDLVGGQFHSTRVILDLAVTSLESLASSAQVNTLGLPSAINNVQINAVIRIPTKIDLASAQTQILTNLTDHGVASSGNGPTDPFSPTFDVLRAFRSGGKTTLTQDPFDGFLADTSPPRVVGNQTIVLSNLVATGASTFTSDVTFVTVPCAVTPKLGDGVRIGQSLLEVVSAGTPPVGGTSTGVGLRLVAGSTGDVVAGPADFRTVFNPADGHVPGCFVRFTPPSLAPPTAGVLTSAEVQVSFSEPMNPERLEAFSNFRLIDPTKVTTNPLEDVLATSISASPELTQFTSAPGFPLDHTLGQTESFQLVVGSGPTGVTDLAGNALAIPFPTIPFTIDATEPTVLSGSFSLTFNAADEDGNSNPEIRGQYIRDLSSGSIVPRAPTRFTKFLDATSDSAPTVTIMPPSDLLTPTWLQSSETAPLSKFGNRVMAVWRYHDLGFSLYGVHNTTTPEFHDDTFNLDVEGISWNPLGGNLSVDLYPDFQMELAHCRWLPDEAFDAKVPVALWPSSGLVATFDSNLLDPSVVVHPRQKGYTILPLNSFSTSSGTLMMPYPWNRDVPVANYLYWTYRDTSVLEVGGALSAGAPTTYNLLTDPLSKAYVGYSAGKVPTVGLPMLMQFRNVSSASSAMVHRLRTTDPSFGDPGFRPYFRAISEGGILADGTTTKFVDPYAQITAEGFLIGGVTTLGTDDKFYYGSADFVVRISRVHTIWFNSGGLSEWTTAVVEPSVATLPLGTSVEVHYRGAASVAPAATGAQNANNLDPYGDGRSGSNLAVGFFQGDNTWKSNVSQLNGAQFLQMRITMISNAQSMVSPSLRGIGVSWRR